MPIFRAIGSRLPFLRPESWWYLASCSLLFLASGCSTLPNIEGLPRLPSFSLGGQHERESAKLSPYAANGMLPQEARASLSRDLKGFSTPPPEDVLLRSNAVCRAKEIVKLSSTIQSASGSGVAVLPPPRIEITPEVKGQLRYLTEVDSTFVARAVERRDELFATLAQIFLDEGVPLELLNVALIESGFVRGARSRAGAVGLWQFMRGTGRVYGLQVSRHEDQRKDVVLATIAAARHLRDLFAIYRDWYLVLAAYNAGPGTVDRAIERSGSTNFWELVRQGRLPAETRQYVPRFIAATIIARYMSGHSDFDRASFNMLVKSLEQEEEKGGDDAQSASNWSGNRRSSVG